MIKYAQVGGHKTYLQSLDVRTLGVAGGSMVRVRDGKIVDIGPRSAHIAGKEYECFAPEGAIPSAEARLVSPRADDPCEYVTVFTPDGSEYSLTLAGAANLLGYVPEGDYARGIDSSTEAAWQALGKLVGMDARQAARQAIDIATAKLAVVVDGLISEYGMDKGFLTLVGGGGSGSVIVNALAERMKLKVRLAKNAPYISTIGVALAMVREQMERTVANPSDADIKKIRADVVEQIVRSGAKEETVDVAIEIDAQRNILRAIATGATELRKKDPGAGACTNEKLAAIAADALGVPAEDVSFICETGRWRLFEGVAIKKAFGIFKHRVRSVVVIDREGVVHLRKEKAERIKFRKEERERRFNPFLNEHTTYSDANATIPKVFAFYREKMLDLTGMQTADQVYSILDVETEAMQPEDEILTVLYK